MSLEATCCCEHCNAHLRAVRVGRDVVHVDTAAHAGGEIVLFAGDWLRVVPEHEPPTRYTIKASQIGMAQRFHEHDMHCKARPKTPLPMAQTRDVRPRKRTMKGFGDGR